MSRSKLLDWINAAKILRDDPKALVVCPTCNGGHLKAKDVVVKEDDKCSRYISCDQCSSYNVITFSMQRD